MTTETVEERAQRLVRDEVLICLSSLIYELSTNDVGDKLEVAEELYDLSVNRDFEEPVLDHLNELPREELVELLEDAGFQCYDHETDGELANAYLEHLKSEGDLEDFANDNRIDPHDIEAYEHWAVTGWLAGMLRDQGETVITLFNMNVWARTTTGQMIYIDGVMQRIATDLLS